MANTSALSRGTFAVVSVGAMGGHLSDALEIGY
jgi:hypothetical protein